MTTNKEIIYVETALERRLFTKETQFVKFQFRSSNCWGCDGITVQNSNNNTKCCLCHSEDEATCGCLPQRLVRLEAPRVGATAMLCENCHRSAVNYCIISHVYGNAASAAKLRVQGAYWDMPISQPAKFQSAVNHAKFQKFEWMWMDICCLPQSKAATIIRARELSYMSDYYKKARKQLVILEDCTGNHAQILLQSIEIARKPFSTKATAATR